MSDIHRAFWRWHFYAGLIVMPVLMLMALTGGLYLFRTQIDDAVYRPLMFVAARSAAASPDAWAAAALNAVPGKLVQVDVPADPARSARLVVQAADGGARRAVYVDPHDARVLGSTPDSGVMAIIKQIHSLSFAGPIPNLLVEIVAGWAIVMVATGIVLWFPRGQKGGVVTVRGSPSQRLFWRDLHAVTGLFAGAVIVFLAVTGMPWSAVWGAQARKVVAEQGWGRPPSPVGGPAGEEDHSAHGGPPPVPWALQGKSMTVPRDAPLPLGKVMAHVEALGLPRPYSVSIPGVPGKAWTAAHQPDKVEDTRTLFLDPATGQALADMRFGQFGGGAKAIEWGIAVHQGQQFGWVNKLAMLAGCAAIWVLGLSALTMWWKRRPKGSLGAPSRPLDRRAYGPLAAVVVPLAVIYPLVGASLIAVLGGDLLISKVRS